MGTAFGSIGVAFRGWMIALDAIGIFNGGAGK
jgi:hypothetical protein